MTSWPLQPPTFINPFLVRRLPGEGLVQTGQVSILGEVLSFSSSPPPYPDGTLVWVFIKRDFYCESLVERDAARQVQLELQKEHQQRVIAAEQQRIAVAQAFNSGLNIPVSWRPDHKRVLSGLTETSAGDGCYQRTVFHVLLLEPLQAGRLRRQAGEFLCSPDNGRMPEYLIWPNNDFVTEVTCKKCLAIARRWSNNGYSE